MPSLFQFPSTLPSELLPAGSCKYQSTALRGGVSHYLNPDRCFSALLATRMRDTDALNLEISRVQLDRSAPDGELACQAMGPRMKEYKYHYTLGSRAMRVCLGALGPAAQLQRCSSA